MSGGSTEGVARLIVQPIHPGPLKREPKSASGPSPMSNFGRAARQSTSIRSALGWRPRHRSCGPSARFRRSEWRNSPRSFNFPMPTKIPTNWTAGADFLPVFSTSLENAPQNTESNQHSLRNSILSRARLPVPPQGPSVAGRRAGAAKRAEYSGQPARVNPRGCDCGVPRHLGGDGIGRCCLFEHGLCSGERP